jgi:DDE superfamily endonuclease
MTGEYLARMERILWLYSQPFDEQYPVVCYDERPCFLIGELVQGLELKAGQVRREHYAYEKKGSCALLGTIEPLTGKRIFAVFDQRRKREFAEHFKRVAAEFPKAVKIRVVLDNLNTHNASAFYETFPAAEAFELAQKFEFYYTPVRASWLNMIEIEFSALARQCLSRRIASREELEREVLAIVKEREENRILINWQFSIEKARKKLNRHYEKVIDENSKSNKT